jgi:hypothetical protein
VLDLLDKAGIQLEGLSKLENIFPVSVVENIEKATNAMKAYKKAREDAFN